MAALDTLLSRISTAQYIEDVQRFERTSNTSGFSPEELAIYQQVVNNALENLPNRPGDPQVTEQLIPDDSTTPRLTEADRELIEQQRAILDSCVSTNHQRQQQPAMVPPTNPNPAPQGQEQPAHQIPHGNGTQSLLPRRNIEVIRPDQNPPGGDANGNWGDCIFRICGVFLDVMQSLFQSVSSCFQWVGSYLGCGDSTERGPDVSGDQQQNEAQNQNEAQGQGGAQNQDGVQGQDGAQGQNQIQQLNGVIERDGLQDPSHNMNYLCQVIVRLCRKISDVADYQFEGNSFLATLGAVPDNLKDLEGGSFTNEVDPKIDTKLNALFNSMRSEELKAWAFSITKDGSTVFWGLVVGKRSVWLVTLGQELSVKKINTRPEIAILLKDINDRIRGAQINWYTFEKHAEE